MYPKYITTYKYTWCWKFSIVCCIYLGHKYPVLNRPMLQVEEAKAYWMGLFMPTLQSAFGSSESQE